MDDATKPQPSIESAPPSRPDLDSWRGDIRDRPPIWRRRPRRERMQLLWNATKPLLSQLGEGQSWT